MAMQVGPNICPYSARSGRHKTRCMPSTLASAYGWMLSHPLTATSSLLPVIRCLRPCSALAIPAAFG